MSADDRRTLGSLLEFYVDTGDSIRYFPNPSVFYSGNIAVSTITAAGQATITAIGSVIQKGQQFFYSGVLYTVQGTVPIGDTNFNVLPRPEITILGNQTTAVLTPLSATNPGLGETKNVISKSTGFNHRIRY
jgi:hypothetical protein